MKTPKRTIARRTLGIIVLPVFAPFVIVYIAMLAMFGLRGTLKDAIDDVWFVWKQAYWD